MKNSAPPQSLHGHAVMRMIAQADPPHTTASLRQAVDDAFGENTRFHTCSADRMDLDQLLGFLVERGKVQRADGRWICDPAQICDHE